MCGTRHCKERMGLRCKGVIDGSRKEGSEPVKAWFFITVLMHLPADEILIIWTWIVSLRDSRRCGRTVPWYTSGFT